MTYSVILVEPENPGSIGFVARAMKNFGASELILVNPCAITAMTRARAMHSWDIVENARTVKSFDKAIAGFDEVIAATAKTKDASTTRASVTPRELAQQAGKGRYALVFGRESRGLTNEELRKCGVIVHIETPGYHSLNLAHAVAIVLYELFSAKENPRRESKGKEKRALLMLVGKAARKSGMRNPENAVKMFSNVISRAFISGSEARGIAGVISRLLG